MENIKSEIDTPEGRDWLTGLLREREVVVTFTKKNGEERKMTSTLNFDLIPEEFRPKTQVDPNQMELEFEKVPTSLAVYDVNAKGWRSFLWANVKQVDFTLGEQNG
jgi:hypothetical protein